MKVAQLDRVRESRIRELEKELKVQVLALHPETQQARLSQEQMARLDAMEMELGVTLVAYESTAPLKLAHPSAEQLKEITEVEKKLGLVLVAYELNRQELTEQYAVSEQDALSAKLSAKQYKRLQAVEAEVGLTLMAYTKAK